MIDFLPSRRQRVNNEEKGQNFQKISYRTHQYLTGGLKMGK